ncbi:hypothetical protein ACWD1Z_06540 [Streptomyces sp. NPDC002784]
MVLDPLIELRDVNKYYGELQVPQDVDLAVGSMIRPAPAARRASTTMGGSSP